MAPTIVISTRDFQLRWNVLSMSFSERESEKWPLGLRDWSLLIPGPGAEGIALFSPKNS